MTDTALAITNMQEQMMIYALVSLIEKKIAVAVRYMQKKKTRVSSWFFCFYRLSSSRIICLMSFLNACSFIGTAAGC